MILKDISQTVLNILNDFFLCEKLNKYKTQLIIFYLTVELTKVLLDFSYNFCEIVLY